MSAYLQNSEFKRLCNDVREKLLIFQDHKRFPWNVDCWGRWGARNMALSCLVGVGRSQQVTNPSYTEFDS